MRVVLILGLLIYTCGAFGLGALLVLWLRDPGGLRKPAACLIGKSLRETLRIGGAMLTISFVWFVINTLSTLLRLVGSTNLWFFDTIQLWLTFLFPPVIMHLYYVDATGALGRSPGRLWRAALVPAYIATQALAVWSILTFWRVLPASIPFATNVVNLAILGGFLVAITYAVILTIRSSGTVQSRSDRKSRRGDAVLFLWMCALLLLIIAVPATRVRGGMAILFGLADIAVKSMPLFFMFVGTYFDNRFKFFDLFVKRGLALLLTIGSLTAAFALLLPGLDQTPSWAAPWVWAVVVLPVVTAVPWLYARVAEMLDRWWLGRRFTPVQAVKHFLSGLRSATSEKQLIDRAEQGLTEIFDAPVCVRLAESAAPPSFRIRQEVPVPAGDGSLGWFLMGPRSSDAPYFSQDVALLGSLADVFASVLDNLRLQERKLEQDQLARELTLHASRSELKALRAQINPHFFFNALNAIAGLIHKDPAVADRTIEQLADVFRYALRGSESEWAVLDDEIQFVKAYLDVERARFGQRLSVDVRLADDVRGARVPTMIVQTLVENAVKHGVAEVRGPAVVQIDARRSGDKLVVSVADNGPGFSSPAESAQTRTKGGGYGLDNIRRRLDGYFGPAASLSVDRDARTGMTIAAVSLPLERHTRAFASGTAVAEPVR